MMDEINALTAPKKVVDGLTEVFEGLAQMFEGVSDQLELLGRKLAGVTPHGTASSQEAAQEDPKGRGGCGQAGGTCH